jgi:hypothetical protein
MANRRFISARRKKASPLAWVLVMALLVGAAYIGAAGKLGAWLAEHVVQPVFVTLGIFTAQATQSPGQTQKPAVSVSVAGFSVYALQTGIFSDENNAKSAAKTISAQGGAGYLRKDGNSTRVLLSVYATEADAVKVREQLKSTLQTRLYPIVCPGGTATVYTELQAKNLKAVVAKIASVRAALLEAALGATNDANGQKKVQSAKAALTDFKAGLASSVPAGQSVYADTLDEACQEALAMLVKAESGDTTQRSSNAQSACLAFCFGCLDAITAQ